MSLIRCPECKRIISSTVEACPHCGYRLSDAEKEIALEDAKNNPIDVGYETTATTTQNSEPEDEGSSGAGFALGLLLGIFGLLIALAVGKKNTKSGALGGFIIQALIGLFIWFISSYA